VQNCANLVYKHQKYIFVNERQNGTTWDIDMYLILKKILPSSHVVTCNRVIYLKLELENNRKKTRAKSKGLKALSGVGFFWRGYLAFSIQPRG